MKNKYINIEDIIKRDMHKQDLIKQGFKFINRTNKYKKALAYIIIVFGVVTLPFPTGSVLLIGLGLSMLGLKKDYLKRYYKLLIYRMKAQRRNKI